MSAACGILAESPPRWKGPSPVGAWPRWGKVALGPDSGWSWCRRGLSRPGPAARSRLDRERMDPEYRVPYIERPGVRIRPCRTTEVLGKNKPIQSLNGGSSNGRTTDSDSVNLGSNPSPPANYFKDLAENSRVAWASGVTPGVTFRRLARQRAAQGGRRPRAAQKRPPVRLSSEPRCRGPAPRKRGCAASPGASGNGLFNAPSLETLRSIG
jgi:hypothetical protein